MHCIYYVPHLYIYLYNDKDLLLFDSFCLNYTVIQYTVSSWCNFGSFLLTVTFSFFSNWIIFTACSLRELQNVLIKPSKQYKVWLFLILSNAHIVDKEYQKGIYLSIFFLEVLSGLFLRFFFNQRFKVSINNVWHFTWLHILIKF